MSRVLDRLCIYPCIIRLKQLSCCLDSGRKYVKLITFNCINWIHFNTFFFVLCWKKNTGNKIKWIIFKQKGICLIIVYFIIFISIVNKMDDNGGSKISHEAKLLYRLVNLIHRRLLFWLLWVIINLFFSGMIWFYTSP